MKVGGKISYSTCSLNPIEDEAVVAAVLKIYGKKIKLCSVDLPGFKFQPGLSSWKFMNLKQKEECELIDQSGENISYFNSYNSIDEVPADQLFNKNAKIIKETMFSSFYSDDIRKELNKCLRVLPHH